MIELLLDIARVLVSTVIGVLVGLGLSFSICFLSACLMGNDAGVAMVMGWVFLFGPISSLVCGLLGAVLCIRSIRER